MQDRRLYFRVILKALTLLGIFTLLLVLFNSTFTVDGEEHQQVTLDIVDMKKGQIKKTHWNEKEVAILYRQNPIEEKPNLFAMRNQDIHKSLKPWVRSQKPEYFVYINAGDSGNCPLFYNQGIFKDICTANQFDENGRGVGKGQQHVTIKIPPHHFKENEVVFGVWDQQTKDTPSGF